MTEEKAMSEIKETVCWGGHGTCFSDPRVGKLIDWLKAIMVWVESPQWCSGSCLLGLYLPSPFHVWKHGLSWLSLIMSSGIQWHTGVQAIDTRGYEKAQQGGTLLPEWGQEDPLGGVPGDPGRWCGPGWWQLCATFVNAARQGLLLCPPWCNLGESKKEDLVFIF